MMMVSTAPSMGNKTTLPVRKTTPIAPPIHTHHGCAAAAAKSTFGPEMARATAAAQHTATKKEMSDAGIGAPMLLRSRAFTAVWAGTTDPTPRAAPTSNYWAAYWTRVPMLSPATARAMLPSLRRLNTKMGMLLSMHRLNAVASATFRSFSRASRGVISV